MYARITFSKFPRMVLQYHEQKIEKGVADFLYAGNFVKDKEQLTPRDKMYHFERLATLNRRIRRTILQVSMNFHPGDQLSNDKMQTIALSYLRQMGLDRQPFLIYRHRDTPHPHLHVVSSAVDAGGERVAINRKEIHDSLMVTKQLEREFGLVPARSNRPEGQRIRSTHPPEKVDLHRTPLLPAISKVLDEVIPHYKYTSLPELNAVLQSYNLMADRGKETTRIYKNRGLVYRPITSERRTANFYIKASALVSRPTLKNLETRFAENLVLREADRVRVTSAIDWAFFKKSPDVDAFRKAMEKERISTVLKKDESGAIQDIWYVDYETKAVFDGKALGERYTASAIEGRCVAKELYLKEQLVAERQQLKLRNL